MLTNQLPPILALQTLHLGLAAAGVSDDFGSFVCIKNHTLNPLVKVTPVDTDAKVTVNCVTTKPLVTLDHYTDVC